MEQSPDFQHQIDQWFTNSSSPYAQLAYSYIDEGLATGLGNGWAYKQIYQTLDPNPWYDNKFIDGFGHALFPMIEQYLKDGKSLDQDFVNESIKVFKQAFPKAINETAVLMNKLEIFANNEKDSEIDAIINSIHNYFNIRLMKFSAPILDLKSKENLKQKNITKLLIIDSDHKNTVDGLQKLYPSLKIQTPINTIDILKDKESLSTLIIVNIEEASKLQSAYKLLSTITYLEDRMNYKIK